MRKFYYSALFLLPFIFSCGFKQIEYDNQSKLEGFIKSKINLDVKDNNNDFLLIVLKNENCICTEPDMKLAKDLIGSPKYRSYKKVLIVDGKDHKIFRKLTKNQVADVTVILDQRSSLLQYGYIAMTDRIILYQRGRSVYYADLHIKKPEVVEGEVL